MSSWSPPPLSRWRPQCAPARRAAATRPARCGCRAARCCAQTAGSAPLARLRRWVQRQQELHLRLPSRKHRCAVGVPGQAFSRHLLLTRSVTVLYETALRCCSSRRVDCSLRRASRLPRCSCVTRHWRRRRRSWSGGCGWRQAGRRKEHQRATGPAKGTTKIVVVAAVAGHRGTR